LSKPISLLTFASAAALAAGALMPSAVQAAAILWTGGTDNNWMTPGNWSPSGPPITTSAITIGNTTNNPVQISNAVSLNATSGTNVGSLTVGTGVGSTESVNITSTGSLAMGTHAITLSGGSITGSGAVSGTGAIQGFGTFSAPDASSAAWNANSASGALTLSGGNAYHGTFTTSSSGGGFNLNGVTLSGISTSGSGGTYNLNGATINGATLSNVNGQLNVTGDSALSGTINWFQYNTFNIGDGNGSHTLNLSTATLSTVTGGPAPFIIGAGGTLNDYNGTSSMGGGGSVTLNGGSITNTSGTGGTTAGLFTVGDPISGNGTVSGNVAITAGNLNVSGGTLTLNGGAGGANTGIVLGTSSSGPGISVGSGNILDLQGSVTVASGANMNPGGGTIKLDGTTIYNHNINNSGLTTSGTFDVVNASTLNNVAFSTGNGANLQADAPLTVTNGASLNATNVTVNGAGALNLLNTTGTTALTTHNLSMAQGSTLKVAGSNDGIALTGNFSFQQTDPVNSWTYGSTAGLGPDLKMNGGTSSNPAAQKLEVGGVNQGYVPAGFMGNFALDSLMVGAFTTVGLVDQYANATPSGWVSGNEALYLDALFGTTTASGATPTAVLDEMGLDVFLQG
jgi:hypothetical protein